MTKLEQKALDIAVKYKQKTLLEARMNLKYYLRMQDERKDDTRDTRDYTPEIKRHQNIIKKILSKNPEYFL